jgi:hypothetical protein
MKMSLKLSAVLALLVVLWSAAPDVFAVEIRGIGGKCVDARGGGSANGTQIILWECHGGPNQQWHSEMNFGQMNGKAIVGVGGKCLDVSGGNMQPGTPVILWDCHGGPNQLWVQQGGGYNTTITNRGMCLNAEGGGGGDGTRLIIWPCSGTRNEKWHVY